MKDQPKNQNAVTRQSVVEAVRERGITEALTHDRHFAQEGFTILL